MFFNTFTKAYKWVIHLKQYALFPVWVIGFFLGLHIAPTFGVQYHGFYFTAACEPVGFAGLLAVFFLPFIAVLPAIYFKNKSFLILVAACIAFVLGYNIAMLKAAFGLSAWLIRSFLLFSCTFNCCLLMWLIWICLNVERKHLKKYCIVYTVTSFFLCILDYYFISNFIAGIL